MSLAHSTIKRLAFIRYLYQAAIMQSHAPAPLSCASLLTMHDAVELFLQLASEHLNVGKSKPEFMEYWKPISSKLDRELEQKESMRRLNDARVALKHHGIFPSELDIESFRGCVTSFFADNTPLVFGVNLTGVSLVEFVNPTAARDRLKSAEQFIDSGNTLKALDDIGIAFHEMIADYEGRKQDDKFTASPFYVGEDFTYYTSFFMGLSGAPERRLAEFVDKVKESFMAMQEAIRIIALGLDYRKYTRFWRLTPLVEVTLEGYSPMRRFQEENKPSKEECRFCIDFVVESALILSEFDYTWPPKTLSRSTVAE